jgi:peptidoglycan/xylan/chitin deacetylase (PgdA/CDA1 family)
MARAPSEERRRERRNGPTRRPESAEVWLLEEDELWTDTQPPNGPVTPPRELDWIEPPPRREAPARRAARRRRRRMVGLRRLAVAVGLLVALVVGVLVLIRTLAAPSLESSGPEDGAVLGPGQLPGLTFSVEDADPGVLTWRLDGREVRPTERGGRLVYHPIGLGDGEHEFELVAGGGFLGSETRKSWTFTVDTTPPRVRLTRAAVGYAWRPVVAAGTVEDGATLRANGRRVRVVDGRFTLRYATPPPRPVILSAVDAVGNGIRWRMPVTLVPRLPRVPVRAVHVSADGWADSKLRQGVLRLIEQGRINAVELDLKDEGGIVGWPADVPYGREIGAVKNIYDLRAAVGLLHSKGVRVIGRLVAFRDPVHAQAAWAAGDRDQLVQTPDGGRYSGYGGFTNFASPEVRRYNIAVAVAAAKLGVDEVLYDYVRRPDGPISSMVFPGIRGTPERSIVNFLAETRRALRPYGTFLGASVFGVAATRPLEVAQDIPAMARQVDYISPMVYPSHWAPGEYDVADPNGQPYDIVRRSVEDFERKVDGTGARVVPWLQDFSLGRTYGPDEVRAQIRGTKDAGIREFLLWDPAVTYTEVAMPATASLPATGTAPLRKLRAKGPALIPLGRLSGPGPGGQGAGGPLFAGAPNELGDVPVLMHHRVANEPSSSYDITPREFRLELQRLWNDGFAPVRAVDLVNGTIALPAGKAPVVMTFDDGDESQFGLLPNGQVKPGTAVGIMLEFAETHPGFKAAATFYPNREPFGATDEEAARLLRWLVANGFEVGNHTVDHVALSTLGEDEVQEQLGAQANFLEAALPDYRVRTMALPFGALPENRRLAVQGTYDERPYGPYGVFLVGSHAAPSPFSNRFDPAAIPRIRTSRLPWRAVQDNYDFAYWLDRLERNRRAVYVSDGDPSVVTFPSSRAAELAPRYEGKANPS